MGTLEDQITYCNDLFTSNNRCVKHINKNLFLKIFILPILNQLLDAKEEEKILYKVKELLFILNMCIKELTSSPLVIAFVLELMISPRISKDCLNMCREEIEIQAKENVMIFDSNNEASKNLLSNLFKSTIDPFKIFTRHYEEHESVLKEAPRVCSSIAMTRKPSLKKDDSAKPSPDACTGPPPPPLVPHHSTDSETSQKKWAEVSEKMPAEAEKPQAPEERSGSKSRGSYTVFGKISSALTKVSSFIYSKPPPRKSSEEALLETVDSSVKIISQLKLSNSAVVGSSLKSLENLMDQLSKDSSQLPLNMLLDSISGLSQHFLFHPTFVEIDSSMVDNPYHTKLFDVLAFENDSIGILFACVMDTLLKRVISNKIIDRVMNKIRLTLRVRPTDEFTSDINSFTDFNMILLLKYFKSIEHSKVDVKLTIYNVLEQYCAYKKDKMLKFDPCFVDFFSKSYSDEISNMKDFIKGDNVGHLVEFLESKQNIYESDILPIIKNPEIIKELCKPVADKYKTTVVQMNKEFILTAAVNMLLMKRLRYKCLSSYKNMTFSNLSHRAAIGMNINKCTSLTWRCGGSISKSNSLKVHRVENKKNNDKLCIIEDDLHLILAREETSSYEIIMLERLYLLKVHHKLNEISISHISNSNNIYCYMKDELECKELFDLLQQKMTRLSGLLLQALTYLWNAMTSDAKE